MSKFIPSSVIKKMANLIRQYDGPLTQDLLRQPGQFGLGQVPSRLKPDLVTRLVCGYCSTGCALNAHIKDGQAVNLSPNPEYPVNLGMACPKGWEALTPLEAKDRGTTPLVRNASGQLTPTSWSEAVGEFVDRLRRVSDEHGPESMAFLSTGQMVTEEMFSLGVLAKLGLGMQHGDGNTRQCMASAVVAYKEAFGFDAPPYTYADFEASDVIVLVGSNLCIAHPIMWERICRNKNNPEIVVIDPRKTETAMAATHHLAIQPKSDILLFYGIASVLITRGWIDEAYVAAHIEGFDEFKMFLKQKDYTPESVALQVGINVDQIESLAELIHRGKAVSFWWTMGVNQGHQAVRTAQAIINIALITGNMGRPGTGANSITGQCNAMGSRLFSNTTCLPAGRDFGNSRHREEVAEALSVDVERVPKQASLAYDQIFEQIRAGKIKALWVIATNGAHSWIHQNQAKDTLAKLDVLIVQDMYPTSETAQLADIYLPAAGWGEKDGTFINSERRIGLVKKVRRAPGEALSDFYIFRLIAEAWGCGELLAQWPTPEDAFEVMKELSRGQPCDFSAIRGYEDLELQGGIQWPYSEQDKYMHERRLFTDGAFYRSGGRAKIRFTDYEYPPERPDVDYPLVLLTGRGSSSEWHTQTRTAKSPVLKKLHRDAWIIDMHPVDAQKIGVHDRSSVRVRSRRGEIVAKLSINTTVKPGEVFMAMHGAGANQLTHPSFDPFSRQPNYKYCAVSVSAHV